MSKYDSFPSHLLYKYMVDCMNIVKEYEDDFPLYSHKIKTALNEDHVRSRIARWKYTGVHWFVAIESMGAFNEKVTGFYLLQESDTIFEKDDVIAQELYLFASKKHPGTAIHLLRAGKKLAEKRGWLWIDNFHTSGYHDDRIDKLYELVGAKKIGKIFRTVVGE